MESLTHVASRHSWHPCNWLAQAARPEPSAHCSSPTVLDSVTASFYGNLLLWLLPGLGLL